MARAATVVHVMTRAVLLVEDDAATREQLADAVSLHPNLELVAAVGTLADARRCLREGGIDVLLTDLGLPDGSGIDLVRDATRDGAALALVITVFGDENHIVDAIRAGAMGYLLKDHPQSRVGDAIMELVHGGSPISPAIARYLLRNMQAEAHPRPEADAPVLSEREREVLHFIVKGFSYGEIAGMIGISPHTVATHIRKIYRKLSVNSRGEAVYEAMKMGLVEMDE